jgi:hypothetical protein
VPLFLDLGGNVRRSGGKIGFRRLESLYRRRLDVYGGFLPGLTILPYLVYADVQLLVGSDVVDARFKEYVIEPEANGLGAGA